jgi:hypothetical protein
VTAPCDRAAAEVAAFGGQEIRDRLQRRGLPGAIGAEKSHDRAFRDLERDATQRQDRMTIQHLDRVDVEE